MKYYARIIPSCPARRVVAAGQRFIKVSEEEVGGFLATWYTVTKAEAEELDRKRENGLPIFEVADEVKLRELERQREEAAQAGRRAARTVRRGRAIPEIADAKPVVNIEPDAGEAEIGDAMPAAPAAADATPAPADTPKKRSRG